jgi:rare lipoprotein A
MRRNHSAQVFRFVLGPCGKSFCLLVLLGLTDLGLAATLELPVPATGKASWYGETHRGRLMANGEPFDPDRMTAASWFYPLGTRVRVSLDTGSGAAATVVVTITDRGPARALVQHGRVIDLSAAAFRKLAQPRLGLIPVRVEVAGSNPPADHWPRRSWLSMRPASGRTVLATQAEARSLGTGRRKPASTEG